jgi:hypothetical protein
MTLQAAQDLVETTIGLPFSLLFLS